MLDQRRIQAGLARTLKGRIAHDDELGIRYAAGPAGEIVLRLPYAPFLADRDGERTVGPGGLVTLLDSVCGVGAMAALGFEEAVATLDLRIDYLRPPRPESDVCATARMLAVNGSPGRGSVAMRGEALQDGHNQPIAIATGLFIRRPLRHEPRPFEELPPAALATAETYDALMGFSPDGQGRIRMPFRPGLVGNGSLPSLHGGAIAAHLQEAARAAIGQAVRTRFALTTAHFAFLRFGGPAELLATPEIDRLGATAAFVRVASFQQDHHRPTATGSFTFMRAFGRL